MKVFLSALHYGGRPRDGVLDLLLDRPSGGGDDLKIMLSALHYGAQEKAIEPLLKEREEMKIFLSGLKDNDIDYTAPHLGLTKDLNPDPPLLWNLCSYYYMRTDEEAGTIVRNNSREILVDSGAFSIQQGAKANYDQYVKDYADFISTWDRKNVIGYFEMDVDKVVGLDRVYQYRKQLEQVTDKIIPVWHPNRGIKDFLNMCDQYSGRIIAIPGLLSKGEVKETDYIKFLRTAHDHNCKLHCLGMTRKSVLDKVPFDYVDSSSWAMSVVFGKIGDHKKKIDQTFFNQNRGEIFAYSYREAMKVQLHYYQKWRHVSKD